MTTLTVNISETPSKSYPIFINNDDLKDLKEHLEEDTKERKKL